MAEVAVRFAIPSEPLRPFISTYWELEAIGDGLVEGMLHPEWANIRTTLDSIWSYGPTKEEVAELSTPIIIHGPTSRPTYINGVAGRNFGIGILPTGWSRIIRADASLYADQFPPLAQVLGGDAEALFEVIKRQPDFASRAAAAAKARAAMFGQPPQGLHQTEKNQDGKRQYRWLK